MSSKTRYNKRNIRTISFFTRFGYRTYLREVLQYNTSTGNVTYTNNIEIKI